MNFCFVGDYVPSSPSKREDWNGLAIANLECAFSDGKIQSGKAYASVLPLSCMEYISSGRFAALSLANNHVNDAGNFNLTYAELKKRFPEIQFFGTKEKPYAEFVDGLRRIIVIGSLERCRSRGSFIFKQESVVTLIKKLRTSMCDFDQTMIYIYPHWGKEGEYTRWPSPMQRKLAREWIDAGADGVIGNHSHVPQGMELYRGKPIYYSLGNYFFLGGIDKSVLGSADRMVVTCDGKNWRALFASEDAQKGFERASAVLNDQWTVWKWAKMIGPFYLSKNMTSWKIRMRKSFWNTVPKFLAWQVLPLNLLFRIASIGHKR